MDIHEQQYKEHLNEIKNRIKACTYDELQVMAKTIAEINPDILLAAISEEISENKSVINDFKRILNRD